MTKFSKKKSRRKSNKIRYGIKGNKIIKIYPHKIPNKIGRHNYLLWKTTKKNTPGKTYHGKFYKSKEEAMKFKSRKSRRKSTKHSKFSGGG